MSRRLLLLCLLLACPVARAQERETPAWRALVPQLDAPDPQARERAFWQLVDRHAAAEEGLATLSRDTRLTAQQRWALSRAVRFIARGYTRAFWWVAGDYLDGFEKLTWRARKFRLSQMVRLAGTLALEPMRVIWKTDPAAPVRAQAHSWVARLELRRRRPQINKAVRGDKPEAAVKVIEELVAKYPREPELHYQLAGVRAQARQTGPALKALAQAIALGFDHVRRLKNDPDLANIRETPEFKKLMRKIK